MAESTRKKRSSKVAISKPYPDFPLSPHASGKWQKKVRGKLYYFGRWGRVVKGQMVKLDGDDWWKPALELWKAQADDLYAGRTPRVNRTGDGLKLSDLCNSFLTAKLRKLESGEIGKAMFEDYRKTTDFLIGEFGKDRLVDDITAEDFGVLRKKMSERWGPVRLGNQITRTKTVFKFGFDNGLIAQPIRYGSEFDKPSQSVLRRHKAKKGQRMLEADQLRTLLDASPVPLKAMLLLGVNCGFGNHDCATLDISALDLERGWVEYPRPKTGIDRRCPLWPETVAALRDAVAERIPPKHKDAEQAVFTTTRGRRWMSKGSANPVSVAARDLMKDVGVHSTGIGFYTLRHVFRTIADETCDFPAINLIMGHSERGMAQHYRERIDEARLQAVTEHVRQWLFPVVTEDDNAKGETPNEPNASETIEVDGDDDVTTLRLYVG
jgi:integrase